MNLIKIVGLFAAFFTTCAAIPQVIQTYKTKHARDLSIWQLILLNFGMLLWLIYGIAIYDLPIILANIFSILCYMTLVVMKICYAKSEVQSK